MHATNVLLQLVFALELSPALVTHVRLVLAVRQHVQAHLVCTRKRLLANRTRNLQVGVTDARVLLHTLYDQIETHLNFPIKTILFLMERHK